MFTIISYYMVESMKESSMKQTSESKKKEAFEKRLKELRLNWILTYLLGVHMSASYILTYSTLHNFIVNPSNATCENPGLGGSEVEYSIAVSLPSAGGFFGSVFALTIAKIFLSYKKSMILIPLINCVAFILYGTSVNSWMIMVARFMSGWGIGLTLVIMIWYYVSSTEEYNDLELKLGKPKSSNLKRTLTGKFGLATTTAYIPLSCLVTLIAQFPNVDQFRWPGWFNVAFSCVTIAFMLFFFKDETPSSDCEFSHAYTLCKFKRKYFNLRKDLMIILIIAYAGSTIDAGLKVLETITNPVLSDYFGFDVARLTYFNLGLTALFPLSCVGLLILARLKVSSRWVLLIALIFNSGGLALISNWQLLSSSNDTCENYSILHETTHDANMCMNRDSRECVDVNYWNTESCLANKSAIIYYRNMNLTVTSNENQQDVCRPCHGIELLNECTALKLDNNELCPTDHQAEEITNNYICVYPFDNGDLFVLPSEKFLINCKPDEVYDHFHLDMLDIISSMQISFKSLEQELCEANDECYWNQQSIITGDFCENCPKICRNKETSLNFVQVCIGIVILTMSIEMTRYTMLPMMSKLVSSNMKFFATCFYVLTGGVSSLMTPLWFNTLYVTTGRQTVLPCIVLLVLELPIYFGFVLFYCSRITCKYILDNGASDDPVVLPAHACTKDPGIVLSARTDDSQVILPAHIVNNPGVVLSARTDDPRVVLPTHTDVVATKNPMFELNEFSQNSEGK